MKKTDLFNGATCAYCGKLIEKDETNRFYVKTKRGTVSWYHNTCLFVHTPSRDVNKIH